MAGHDTAAGRHIAHASSPLTSQVLALAAPPVRGESPSPSPSPSPAQTVRTTPHRGAILERHPHARHPRHDRIFRRLSAALDVGGIGIGSARAAT